VLRQNLAGLAFAVTEIVDGPALAVDFHSIRAGAEATVVTLTGRPHDTGVRSPHRRVPDGRAQGA